MSRSDRHSDRASEREPGPALRFEGVAAVRGGREIWTDATFEVPSGGIVAVIGSNGSGKTTLLNLILGLVPVTRGYLSVFGGPPGMDCDRIGYVPQDYAANVGEALRARDAVLLGINGRRWGFGRASREQHAQVSATLAAVEAEGFANKRLAALSGGQRQRVAIAEALVSHPRMLILDEPLASLDLRSQREIVALIARLQRESQMTVLIVAHDLNPLLPILTGAIYLLDGHAHYASLTDVLDADLLTHLYGTPIQVVQTPQGELYTRSL